MESDDETFEEESALELEDVTLSDVDDERTASVALKSPLNIDYNSRITSNLFKRGSKTSDNLYLENESNYSSYHTFNQDIVHDSSCEEFEISDDEDIKPSKSQAKMKLVGNSLVQGKTKSTFNFPDATIREDSLTDAEYISGDDLDEESSRKVRRGGSCKTTLASLKIANAFSDLALLRKTKQADGLESPLMTCMEFLKSENSDAEGTDIEDFSIDASLESSKEQVVDLEKLSQLMPTKSDGGNDGCTLTYRRKPSWTVEYLTEDGDGSLLEPVLVNKNSLHRNSYTNEDEGNTDEETVDIDGKEWTETDESGSVRQITQIKTETSIKLEGGDGSEFDRDGLVSSTTTTTTRVVTSVTTDDPEGTLLQSEQSCEVTFEPGQESEEE